ncbi:short-chain dehydrogenase [Sphaerisporangium krabiense]|uniref:Short-chain dehydrogenase n=1 Tax=Sphaerisporangium krabiense TaxID=763782 RepID=A0A7W8ZBV4_9ACTN|nr:SDR family oxidoreductase [Sphaerisporangium krabiense]MBB5631040.1 hypothetical protein [Sphaerisporangium krabiense]GII65923.1 short-chain dehydrogenase [Sphaerisporangium krabiense]
MTGGDRVALVAGGATVLGEAVVRGLAEDGFTVVVADIDAEAGERLRGAVGGTCVFMPMDITDEDSVRAVVAEAARRGRLEVVVTMVASYADPGLAADADAWVRSLRVNVVGPALVIREAAPHLAASGRGAVVNVASVSADRAQANKLLYPAGKAALGQLTRNLALTLAPSGIRVNGVSPSWVWSAPMARRSGGDRALADEVAAGFHMIPRMADAREVADAIRFLCSASASFITGEDLHVDGGYSALSPEGKVNPWERHARAAAGRPE